MECWRDGDWDKLYEGFSEMFRTNLPAAEKNARLWINTVKKGATGTPGAP